ARGTRLQVSSYARRAAATALSTSASRPRATGARTRPLAGLTVGNVSPAAAGSSWPSMMRGTHWGMRWSGTPWTPTVALDMATAVHVEDGPDDRSRLVGGQVRRGGRDLLWPDEPAQGHRIDEGLPARGRAGVGHETGQHRRIRRPGGDAVDANAGAGQLQRHRLGQADDRRLAGAVSVEARPGPEGGHRGDVDDAAAAIPHQGHGKLDAQEHAFDVDRHQPVPLGAGEGVDG